MAMNLDAVLRIAAKVVGLEDLGALQRGLVGAEKAAGEARSAFGAVVNSASWQAAAAGAVALTAGIGLAAGAALKFEANMANVRRVVSDIETPAALAEITSEILQMSSQTGIAAEGITQIYAAAGQSGIARGEIKQFAEGVAMVSVAFEMTAQEAGGAMATLRSALKLGTTEVMTLAGAFNELSNKSQGSLSARQLVDFTTRVAAIGSTAGFSGQEMAAFGAVMMQNGQQAEVAATGFRNFVAALSKGPSMTDKQIEAMRRLGYSFADAKQIEADLTRVAETESQRRLEVAKRKGDEVVRVAEEQSRKRIESAREETEQLSREIGRRYRNQLQMLQDSWDDEASAREDAVQDRISAQVKALEREQDALIKAANERARISGGNADLEVQRIRDFYEARIDAVRDAGDRELTLMRRKDRDYQQMVRDRIQDQQDAEQKATQARQKAIEDAENSRLKSIKDGVNKEIKETEAAEKQKLETAKAMAKKIGEERAKADLLAFAKRFTQDAKGVTAEVLQKLRQLPKEELYSTLVNFGGEEMARSIITLVDNFDQLSSRMAIATNETATANSVSNEYAVKMATAAAKVAKFREQINNLGIIIGASFLPYLAKAGEILQPLLEGLARFARDNPAVVTAAAAIGAAAAGLILALPVIAGFITSVGIVKAALVGLNLGGLIAGWLPAVVGTLAKLGGLFVIASQGIILAIGTVITWLGSTFLPAVIAFFSGPVGWTVLAVAAVVGMAIAFREPLMKFAAWLWAWGEPIRRFWVDLWNGAKKAVADGFAYIDGIIAQADKSIQDSINQTWQAITKGFETYVTIPLASAWNRITQGFNENLVTPIRNAWTALTTLLPQVLKNAFRGVLQFIADRVNQVGGLINQLIDGYNNLPNFGDIPRVPTLTVPAFAEGGTVSRPTLAMVGDGGEREYIVPESKMAAASARFLSGQRGAAVIPSGSSSRSGGAMSSPVVNITTGPVTQQADGSRWVSLDDLERASQQTAEQILAMLRTPQGRMALMG